MPWDNHIATAVLSAACQPVGVGVGGGSTNPNVGWACSGTGPETDPTVMDNLQIWTQLEWKIIKFGPSQEENPQLLNQSVWKFII